MTSHPTKVWVLHRVVQKQIVHELNPVDRGETHCKPSTNLPSVSKCRILTIIQNREIQEISCL